ncbi:MAG: ADP-ribosylglycohydrolase family protein [Clostridia bacterium]|jgi:ADP-ribosylglycohydrolase
MKLNRNTLRDKIHACWLGKNIGGTMGTPYEGKTEINDIQGFASEPGTPLPNDDLDLQLVWLKALSEVGPQNLDAKVLGEYWLTYIGPPWNEYGVCKSNMRMGIVPPMSGELNNEEWKHSNGAWIRTEIWACTHPGMPEKAIKFAFEDACVDHGFGEGTNAAIFIAAMQSAAFVINDLDALIEIGLSKIPEDCRVARSVKIVLDCYEKGIDWKTARNMIVEDSADLGWFQAPANIAFTILGLKYGEGDFKKSMILAINCGDDTDCTGATVGALLGIMHGTRIIPEDWRAYIGDSIITIAVIQGSAYFPRTCTELTDCVMNLLPVTTYPGLIATGPFQSRSVRVEITDGPDELDEVTPELFKGREFVESFKGRAPYSFTAENVYLSALVEFDGAPEIQPLGEIKVRVTLRHRNCGDYRRYALDWILPEGFEASGKTNLFVKWRGESDGSETAEFVIQAGEQVEAINRLILEISSPGRAIPLLVPVVLLG